MLTFVGAAGGAQHEVTDRPVDRCNRRPDRLAGGFANQRYMRIIRSLLWTEPTVFADGPQLISQRQQFRWQMVRCQPDHPGPPRVTEMLQSNAEGGYRQFAGACFETRLLFAVHRTDEFQRDVIICGRNRPAKAARQPPGRRGDGLAHRIIRPQGEKNSQIGTAVRKPKVSSYNVINITVVRETAFTMIPANGAGLAGCIPG